MAISKVPEYNYRDHQRTAPFRIHTSSTEGSPITFYFSPYEVSWKVGTRTAIDITLGGQIHYEMYTEALELKRHYNTKMDLPVLTFNFQTGNLDNRAYEIEEEPLGIGNFYDFLGLLNQPTIRPDGRINFHHIHYTSSMFHDIYLRGFFTPEGITFSESADDPYNMKWTANFICGLSIPPIFSAKQLVDIFRTSRLKKKPSTNTIDKMNNLFL